MDAFTLLPAGAGRQVPWRNGRGVTEEIAIEPANAALERLDFRWRVAAAPVVEDGPFSVFPGFVRLLIVTHGKGLALRHGPDAPWITLPAGQVHTFPGEAPTEARLLDGPVRDLSVLARQGAATPRLRRLTVEAGACAFDVRPGAALLHAVGGPLEVRPADRGSAPRAPLLLAPGASLLARDLREPLRLVAQGDALSALLVLTFGS